jgi:hypothetical protein
VLEIAEFSKIARRCSGKEIPNCGKIESLSVNEGVPSVAVNQNAPDNGARTSAAVSSQVARPRLWLTRPYCPIRSLWKSIRQVEFGLEFRT